MGEIFMGEIFMGGDYRLTFDLAQPLFELIIQEPTFWGASFRPSSGPHHR